MTYAPLAFARLGPTDPDAPTTDPLEALLAASPPGPPGFEVDLAGPDGSVRMPVRGRSRRRRADTPAPLSLAEICGRIPADCVLSVGVDDAAAAVVAHDIAGSRRGPLWLRAASCEVLEALALRTPAAVRVHATEPDRIKVPFERHAQILHSIGAGAIALPHDAWSAGLVALFHRFGLRTVASEASEVRHVRAVLAMGIDGVSSERVDRVVAAIGEFALRTPE